MKKYLIGYIISCALLCSCEDEKIIEPMFTTTPLNVPRYNYIFLQAEIDKDQENSIIGLIEDHGFVWSTTHNNSFDNSASEVISLGVRKKNYPFGSSIYNLKGNTTYYVRAFIKMNNQIYYADEITFKTKPGTWRKLKDYPGINTLHPAAIVLNDMAYIVCKNEVWAYNSLADTWDRKNDFPVLTNGATGFMINGMGYIYCNNVWRYDPNADQWTALITGSQPTDLSKGCMGVSSIVYEGKAYISGGGNLNEGILVYDPVTNKQYALAFKHQAPNVSFASFLADKGKAFMVGGTDFFLEESKVLSYDLINKSWARKRSFRNDKGFETERAEMVSFHINGNMYTGMGYGTYPFNNYSLIGSNDDFYRYNAENDSWEPQTFPIFIDQNQKTNFLKRAGGIGLSIKDKGYMGLGELRNDDSKDTKALTDFWEFSPN